MASKAAELLPFEFPLPLNQETKNSNKDDSNIASEPIVHPRIINVNILNIKIYIQDYHKKAVSSTGGRGARWAPLAHGLYVFLW